METERGFVPYPGRRGRKWESVAMDHGFGLTEPKSNLSHAPNSTSAVNSDRADAMPQSGSLQQPAQLDKPQPPANNVQQ